MASVECESPIENPLDQQPLDAPELSCQICANNPHKYKCPRCDIKTCSLTCCLEHKQKFNCSGVRDVVVYCRREGYNYERFQQDYHLLEEIDRSNASRERKLSQLTRKNRPRVRARTLLCKIAKENGITLRLTPNSILSRAVLNRSHVVEGENNAKNILWSLEFCLLPADADKRLTNLHRVRSLRLIIHDCDERSRLGSLWDECVVNRSSEEQDTLITYRPAGSPPFGLVASWLYQNIGCTDRERCYFYIQVEQTRTANPGELSKAGITRQLLPLEVFCSNRLSQILITPGYVVHEMPTVWVSRTVLSTESL